MKYSKVKNIILAIFPVLILYLYQKAQIRLQFKASASFDRLPITLFNILVPCTVGVIAFFIIAYAYRNRRSLVFISLFCGGVLVNFLYIAFTFGLFGLKRTMIDMSAASQIAYVLMGAYLSGFWVSLLSYFRTKKSN
ncbi:MAG TPA: hypothetical protein GX734_01440 [Clostridiaceae bacterium]|nr:hypothetical protein [Clostridiaceae bacterium]